MARRFLIRGMLCGAVAGLLVFLFARLFGEAPVDAAIAFEEAAAKAAGEAPEPELVSRGVQAGWGLFVGTMLYAVAIGGLFSLAFAFAWGRVGRLRARATAALLAGASFVGVYLVPFLKYPANPPSIGSGDTIGYRTALYFGMIAISVGAMLAALNLGRSLVGRLDAWHAALVGGAVYAAVVAIAFLALPSIDEVPADFPATLLWQFRLSSLGLQTVLWVVLGLSFGELTERDSSPGRSLRTFPGT
jgi:hypothetical protein